LIKNKLVVVASCLLYWVDEAFKRDILDPFLNQIQRALGLVEGHQMTRAAHDRLREIPVLLDVPGHLAVRWGHPPDGFLGSQELRPPGPGDGRHHGLSERCADDHIQLTRVDQHFVVLQQGTDFALEAHHEIFHEVLLAENAVVVHRSADVDAPPVGGGGYEGVVVGS